MVLPVVLLLGSIAVGFSNYQETKEEMHRDLTNALRQFVIDESRQLLLLDTLHTLHKNSVLTLNNVENSFRDQLTILPLKDTSHVSVCILHNNEREAFREEAFVSSDTLLWHSAQQESSNAVIALKAYANPSFCAMLGHSDQRLSITGILFSILLFSVLSLPKWAGCFITGPLFIHSNLDLLPLLSHSYQSPSRPCSSSLCVAINPLFATMERFVSTISSCLSSFQFYLCLLWYSSSRRLSSTFKNV